jgi:hypothetical protein
MWGPCVRVVINRAPVQQEQSALLPQRIFSSLKTERHNSRRLSSPGLFPAAPLNPFQKESRRPIGSHCSSIVGTIHCFLPFSTKSVWDKMVVRGWTRGHSHGCSRTVHCFVVLLFSICAVPGNVVAFSLQQRTMDRVNLFTLYQATRRTQPAPFLIATPSKSQAAISSQRSILSFSNPTNRLSQQHVLRSIVRYRRKGNRFHSSLRHASESFVSATTWTIGKWSSALPSPAVDVSVLLATAQSLAQTTIELMQDVAVTSVRQFWYLVPSGLCFVPLYTWAAWQALPVTPAVWKLVNMDFVWRTGAGAMSVVTAFLASNACYFLAAAYLLQKGGVLPVPSFLMAASDTKPATTIAPSLGWWVLSAGCMSTLFHTVQAVGDYRIAEALCYLDHGVAGTAVLFYLYTCGRPSGRALLCGGAGLITLAFPAAAWCPPAYTWLHALWHALSALAAVWWACDAPTAPRSM